MHLRDQVSTKTTSPTENEVVIGRDEEALQRCFEAKSCQEAGDYEAARQALGGLWQRVGDTPAVEGLGPLAQAEVLLRVGSLSGRIGSANQIEGAQEIAKDLISHSKRLFEELGLVEKVAETQVDLAICYWRSGGLDEARITLQGALEKVGNVESEQRLRAIVSLAIFEISAGRYREALRVQSENAPLFERSRNHALKGTFHNELALALRNIGEAEGRPDYIDHALIEYTAAVYHFEQADHTRYLALVENNLGFLFLKAGKLIEAHQHLNRARALFVRLKDKGRIAPVDETRARAFLAQGLNSQAETTVRASVRTLEQGDESSLLAEALTTHGVALARLERFERAHAQLRRAINVATNAGDPEKAGLAALTIVEALRSYLPPASLREYYVQAESLLVQSQAPGAEDRLGRCARTILALGESRVGDLKKPDLSDAVLNHVQGDAGTSSQTLTGKPKWTGCSLENQVLHYEGELIQQALEAASGSVTRAARMLGITHQGLAFILNGRHKSLLTVRTPVRKRRKSIFRSE